MINLFLIDFKLYLISSARRKEKKEKQRKRKWERGTFLQKKLALKMSWQPSWPDFRSDLV